MAKNITLTWDLPDVRRDGGALNLDDIQHTVVEASADGGATFGALATVTPDQPQTVTVPDAEVGEWHFRFTVVDTLDQAGVQHTEVVEVIDDSPPGVVTNVQVTLD